MLDEAHHLAATWGELLADVLRQAHGGRSDGPVVVALTATPRDSLSAEQAALVDELFGPVLYSVSTRPLCVTRCSRPTGSSRGSWIRPLLNVSTWRKVPKGGGNWLPR